MNKKIPLFSEFQSTPSVGRATLMKSPIFPFRSISIHALRGEGDASAYALDLTAAQISIHALRGEGDKPAKDLY